MIAHRSPSRAPAPPEAILPSGFAALNARRFLPLPLLDSCPPRLQRAAASGRFVGRLKLRQHFVEHILDVAHDRHINPDALGDRRRIDIDVMILRPIAKKWVADDAVVKAGTDGQQHVAVLHRLIRFVGAMHARHAERLRIGRRETLRPISVLVTGAPNKPDQLGRCGAASLSTTPPPA